MNVKRPNPDAVLPEGAGFPLRLWYQMERQGLTVMRLAEKSGIAHPNIWGYMNGRMEPRMEKLIRLAKALGVSLDWLCGLTDEREKGGQ